MEMIGNPWYFLGVSSTKLDPFLKTYYHLLWLSLFFILLVLAADFENEVPLMVHSDEEVQWDSTHWYNASYHNYNSIWPYYLDIHIRIITKWNQLHAISVLKYHCNLYRQDMSDILSEQSQKGWQMYNMVS